MTKCFYFWNQTEDDWEHQQFSLKCNFSHGKSIHRQQVGVSKNSILKILKISIRESSQWCACINTLLLINNWECFNKTKNYINTLTVTGHIKVSVEHEWILISIVNVLHLKVSKEDFW